MKLPTRFTAQLNNLIPSIDTMLPLLWGLLGGLLGAMSITFFTPQPPTLATVKLDTLVKSAIKAQIKSGIPKAAMLINMQKFSARLDKQLDRIATQHHLILTPKRAILAGAPDVTAIVKEGLKNNG